MDSVTSFQNPSLISVDGGLQKNMSDENMKMLVDSSVSNGQKLDAANDKLAAVSSGITSLLEEVKEMRKELSSIKNTNSTEENIQNESDENLIASSDEVLPSLEATPTVDAVEQPAMEVPQEVQVPEVPSLEAAPAVDAVEQPVMDVPQEVQAPELPTLEAAPTVAPVEQPVMEVPQQAQAPELPSLEAAPAVAPVEQPVMEAPQQAQAPEVTATDDNSIISIDSLLSNSQNSVAPVEAPAAPAQSETLSVAEPSNVPSVPAPQESNVEILNINLSEAQGDGKQRSVIITDQNHTNLMNKNSQGKTYTLAA